MEGKSWSEGLMGGRLIPGIGQESGRSPEGTPKPAAPPKPIPVVELKEGAIMEGQIVEVRHVGFFVEVGATKPGLLRRRHCQFCPQRLLQHGQTLSNLIVLSVDRKRNRFSLALHGIDGSHLHEEAYEQLLARIAGWAGVSSSELKLDEEADCNERPQRRISHARKGGKGKQWQWREKNSADAPSTEPSTTTSSKAKKGYGKSRGKGYGKGDNSNKGWSGGNRWSHW